MGAFHLVKIFGNFGSIENGKRFVGSSHWKIPGKSGKSKKVGPFPCWNFPKGISCSIYTFLVLYTSFNCYQLGSHLGVPSGNGLGAIPGTTFYLWGTDPFLFPLKFPDFLPKWKAPLASSHTLRKTSSRSVNLKKRTITGQDQFALSYFSIKKNLAVLTRSWPYTRITGAGSNLVI